MTIYNREDSRTVLPQIEAKVKKLTEENKLLKERLDEFTTNVSADAEKVGNYYSSGAITAYKKGGCVTVIVSNLGLSALGSRTAVAKLPEGFRPPTETYGYLTLGGSYFLIQNNGDVQFNSGSAVTAWGSATYAQKD